jgi:hypothetical protein
MTKTIEQVQANLKRLRSRLKRTVNAIDKLEKAEKRLLSKARSGVAQSVEQTAVNRSVAGSSPAAGAIEEAKPIPPAIVKTEYAPPPSLGSDPQSAHPSPPPPDLDIPIFMRRAAAAKRRDELAAEVIRQEQEERRKTKARNRIAEMKAKQSGETRKMPLSGKAALAKINAL